MFIIAWLIVLFLTLCILYLMFIAWLAHSLDGYPAFLISRVNRDTAHPPRALFLPNGSALLDTLANSRSIGARPELWTASTAVPRAYKTAERSKTAPT